MFKVDSFLAKGSSHDICEDYIIHGTEPFPYVILSDGCSSSKNTDVGARILVYSAKSILMSYENHLDRVEYHDFGSRVIVRAQTIAESMGLELGCLDATLMLAFIFDGFCYSLCYGDGTIITKLYDYSIYYENYSFSKNTPYYLSYRISQSKYENYKKYSEEKGNHREYTHGLLYNNPEKEVWKLSSSPVIKTELGNINSVLIISDGIESFTHRSDGKQLPYQEVIEQVTDVPNTNGVFMKRTMGSKRGVINSYAKNNIHHYDDISVGAIIYEEGR